MNFNNEQLPNGINLVKNVAIEIIPEPIRSVLSIININGKQGIYDMTNQRFLTDCIYDNITEYNCFPVFMLEKNGEYGLCDFGIQNGAVQCKLLTECQYDFIDLMSTTKDLKYFVLDEGQFMRCYFPQTGYMTDLFSYYCVIDNYLITLSQDEGILLKVPSGEQVQELYKFD